MSVYAGTGGDAPTAATPTGGTGDTTNRLRARVSECMAFAVRTVEAADPSHPLWDIDLGRVTGHDKMLLEASLLALLVDRAGTAPLEVGRLVEQIRGCLDSPRVQAVLMRHPSAAPTLGTTLVVLDRFGLATAQERAVLAAAMTCPWDPGPERVPFRLLDQQWVRHLGGYGGQPDRSTLALSAACRTSSPVYMTREDAYAVTHAVMYGTDFGARDVPPELSTGALTDLVDGCLAWRLAAEDLDLVAELLLTGLLLGEGLSPYARIALNACLSTWDDHGFLPSPSIAPTAFRDADTESDRRQIAFHHMYHTVFVGGLLCNCLIQVGEGRRRPEQPAEVGNDDVVRASAERATTFLAESWRVGAGTVDQVLRDIRFSADTGRLDELGRRWAVHDPGTGAAARMAVDAFVVERCQDYDLAGLAAGLRRAAGPASPTVRVATDFLARQCTPDGRIGIGNLFEPAGPAAVRATAALAACLLTPTDPEVP